MCDVSNNATELVILNIMSHFILSNHYVIRMYSSLSTHLLMCFICDVHVHVCPTMKDMHAYTTCTVLVEHVPLVIFYSVFDNYVIKDVIFSFCMLAHV